jgi:hypothetical protein
MHADRGNTAASMRPALVPAGGSPWWGGVSTAARQGALLRRPQRLDLETRPAGSTRISNNVGQFLPVTNRRSWLQS